jgi:hypothetical protein
MIIDVDRDYERRARLKHSFFGDAGMITVLQDTSRSPPVNRVYHETNARYETHRHVVEGHGVKGDYSWITDEALRSPIESMSFFRSHSGGYFAVRANQHRRREGQRTVYSAENLVVDGTHLYHTSTVSTSTMSLQEGFDELRAFQAGLRDLLVRANA